MERVWRSIGFGVLLAVAFAPTACGGDPGQDDDQDDTAAIEEGIQNCPPNDPCDPPEPPQPPPPKPNLRVQILNGNPSQPWASNYCATGTITFRVVNQGTASAGASWVRVQFDGTGDKYFYVGPLAVGASSATFSTALYYPGGDLSISIKADYANAVSESSETDNTSYGFCIG